MKEPVIVPNCVCVIYNAVSLEGKQSILFSADRKLTSLVREGWHEVAEIFHGFLFVFIELHNGLLEANM